MAKETGTTKKSPGNFPEQNCCEAILLYPGIELFYLCLPAGSVSLPHKPLANMVRINHCRTGRMAWKTEEGNPVYLHGGSFSVSTGQACADTVLTFPAGQYQGLSICIDLPEVSVRPPAPLGDTDVFLPMLWEKLSGNGTAFFSAGSTEAEHIFSALYGGPVNFRPAYRRIKILELLVCLADAGRSCGKEPAEQSSEMRRIVREIHDQLLLHIDRRTTIEELSRQYLINPTTLKAAFKSVYGTSIAAHVKEHRMEQAARLLKESDLSIAEIAQAVGYDSPSRFTAAFKSFFQALPRDYRKKI